MNASENSPAQDPPTSARRVFVGWLSLAAIIGYMCRNSIGVAESTIRTDLNLTTQQTATMMSLFFLPYALGQVPTGWLADRFGSRICLPLFSIASSAATAAMGLSNSLTGLIAARMSNGVAQAGLFPACVNSMAKWIPYERRGIANGILGSSMSVGGAFGSALAGFLIAPIGWRATFMLFGLLGIVWSLAFYWWFRDDPAAHPSVNVSELELIRRVPKDACVDTPSAKPAAEATGGLQLLSLSVSPATWLICGQQFCRAAGQIFFSSWFATYLQNRYAVDVATSGVLTSLPLLALVVGGMMGGSVSDLLLVKTGSLAVARRGLAAVCMLMCGLLVVVAYFVANVSLAVPLICLGTFCAAVGGPCAYSITIDLGGRQVATLFGLMNMIGNFGAFAFIQAVPWYVEETGNWDAVLLLFAGLYLGASLCWALIDTSRDVFQQSFYRVHTHGK